MGRGGLRLRDTLGLAVVENLVRSTLRRRRLVEGALARLEIGRRRERAAIGALKGRIHISLERHRGEGAAVERLQIALKLSVPGTSVVHHRGGEFRGEAHEPRGGYPRGRSFTGRRGAGLAGRRADRLAIAAGAGTAAVDSCLQCGDGVGRDVLRDGLLGLDLVFVERLLLVVVHLLDDVPIGLLASGGNGRVAIGHIHRRNGSITERGREHGFDLGDHRCGNARFSRALENLVGTDFGVATAQLVDEVDEGRVDRLLCGPFQGYGTKGLTAAVTLVLDHSVADPQRRVAIQFCLEAVAVLESRYESKGLEGRPRLGTKSGPVELALEEVRTAIHGTDRAGAGFDGSHGRMQFVETRRPDRLDRGNRGALFLEVEGRDDAQSAAIDLRVGEFERPQLLFDGVEQEALRAAIAVGVALLHEFRQFVAVFGEVTGIESARLGHAVEHVVVTHDDAFLAAFGIRVVIRGAVDDRREHGGLPNSEFRGPMTEIGLRSDFDAIGAVAEVDGVEVALEDFGLGELVVDLDREDCFLDLALDRAFLGQVEDLDILLSDRRRALGRSARRVVARGPHDAFHVDPAVRIKRAVLGRDGRGLHRRRNLVHADVFAVLGRKSADQCFAVGVIDLGGLGLKIRIGIGYADQLVERKEGQCSGDDPRNTEENEPAQRAPPQGKIAAVDLAYKP